MAEVNNSPADNTSASTFTPPLSRVLSSTTLMASSMSCRAWSSCCHSPNSAGSGAVENVHPNRLATGVVSTWTSVSAALRITDSCAAHRTAILAHGDPSTPTTIPRAVLLSAISLPLCVSASDSARFDSAVISLVSCGHEDRGFWLLAAQLANRPGVMVYGQI